MAIRKGYKVLSPGRWSCWVRGQGGGAVQYPVNKWTRPRPHCGPLAVFSLRSHAKDWIFYNYELPVGCTIHACQYKQSRCLKLWRFLGSERLTKDNLPYGTCLANAVRTLE